MCTLFDYAWWRGVPWICVSTSRLPKSEFKKIVPHQPCLMTKGVDQQIVTVQKLNVQISRICAQHGCWPSGMRAARILATWHTSSIVSCIRKKRPFPVNFACTGILEPSWFSSLETKSLHSEFPEIPSKTYSFLSNIIVTRVTSEKSTHIQISCERQSWWWQSCKENLLSLEFSTWVCRDV